MQSRFGRFLSDPIHLSSKPLLLMRKISSKNIEKLARGRGLRVQWDDGEISRFHSSWLRMNCGCEQCKHRFSGQRSINVSQLPKKITLSDFSLSGDNSEVILKWDLDGHHRSRFKLDWLKKHSYGKKDIEHQNNRRKIHSFKTTKPEFVKYEDVSQTNSGLLKFLQTINEEGLAIIKDVPCDDSKFREVVEGIGPIQNTMYGELFDINISPNPDNVAFSSGQLDYHMDMVYCQSPPGINLLHCRRFDREVKGGESIFLDVFAVAEQFRNTNPEEFDTLVRIPATFQHINFNGENSVYMKYQRPHISLNNRKEIVSISWSPIQEGPLFVDEDDVEPYYEAYFAFYRAIVQSDFKMIFRLEEGDVVAFNNRRLLHGRQELELNGGSRFVKGCFVSIDDFRSKVDVMSHLHGDKRISKRVGNNCFF